MKRFPTRQGLRLSTIEAAGAVVFIAFTTGPFLTGLALCLFADDWVLGLIAAIPAVTQVFQFVGAWITQHTGRRKQVALFSGLVGRGLYLPIGLLLFLDWPPERLLFAFMMLFALSNIFMQMGGVAWMSWMSDLVPPRVQGRYYGRRNLALGAVTILATYAAGEFMDAAKAHGRELAGYQTLCIAAAVTGLYCFWILRRQPEPLYRPEPMPGRHYITVPFRNPAFRRLMIFNVCWLFTVNVSAPFFTPHLMKFMHWSYGQLALLGILFSVAAGLAHWLWGGVVDRWGKRPILIFTSLFITCLPHPYLWCPLGSQWPILANAMTGGVLWAGWSLAMFTLMQQLVPAAGRPAYFALWAAISGLANFLAGLAGGQLAQALNGTHLDLGPIALNHYQIIFLISILLRIPALLLLLGIHDPTAQPVGTIVRDTLGWMSRRARAITNTYRYLGGRLRQDSNTSPPDEGPGGF